MDSFISFAGKRVVVTGAYSGIGASLVDLLKMAGADHITVLDIKKPVFEVAEFIETDMSNPISIDSAIEQITAEGSPSVDVLFNNAVNKNPDTARDVDFLNFNEDLFHDNMRVNVLGGVLACKHALPHMLEQGQGSIIFASSTSSIAGEVAQFSYGASKAAVNWYVQTLAATFGKRGVRCNAILPGVIRTAALDGWANDKMVQGFVDIQNVPRLGLPEDIGAMAVYLASDESSYVNGALMRVDGGMSCTTPMVPVVRAYL